MSVIDTCLRCAGPHPTHYCLTAMNPSIPPGFTKVVSVTDGNGADEGATKPSNPKDVIGSRKAPFDLVPSTTELMAVEAHLEGALKYGRYNWRIAGVRASVYYNATQRHLKKWWNGQNSDPMTRINHLKSVLGCIGIMLDADLYGKLEDDRPPCPDPDAMARAIDALEERVAYLKVLFQDHKPKQFTIKDTGDTVK